MDDVDDLQGFQATCLETSLTISVLALDNLLFVDWKIVGKAIAAIYDFHFISFLGGGVGWGELQKLILEQSCSCFSSYIWFNAYVPFLWPVLINYSVMLFWSGLDYQEGALHRPLYKVSFYLGGSRGMGFWLRHAPSPSLAMPLWITFTRHWASWRKLSILVDPYHFWSRGKTDKQKKINK